MRVRPDIVYGRAADGLVKLVREGEAAGIDLQADAVGAAFARRVADALHWLTRCRQLISELGVRGPTFRMYKGLGVGVRASRSQCAALAHALPPAHQRAGGCAARPRRTSTASCKSSDLHSFKSNSRLTHQLRLQACVMLLSSYMSSPHRDLRHAASSAANACSLPLGAGCSNDMQLHQHIERESLELWIDPGWGVICIETYLPAAQALGDDEAALAAKLQMQRDLESEADALPCSVRKDVDKLQVRVGLTLHLTSRPNPLKRCKSSTWMAAAKLSRARAATVSAGLCHGLPACLFVFIVACFVRCLRAGPCCQQLCVSQGSQLESVELIAGCAAQEACKLWCLCRQPYNADRPMLACDYCNDWFHWECVGLDAPGDDEDDEDVAPPDFRCPACCAKARAAWCLMVYRVYGSGFRVGHAIAVSPHGSKEDLASPAFRCFAAGAKARAEC